MVQYNIDIVGTCNLKCPSCARRERYDGPPQAFKGLMDYDLFVRILDKIEANRPGEQHRISLFTWGEPLMHNRIGDIISEVNRRGWSTVISTNGNATKHLEAAIRAKPQVFSISLSGFQKASYNATHYKGDVDTVIGTIFLSWNLVQQYSPQTDFRIHYHLYKDNGGENLASFHRIVHTLDINHSISLAQIIALDDVLADIQGTGNLASEKTNVADKLIVAMKDWKALTAEYNDGTCEQIQQDRVVINADGSVALCCAVYGDQYRLAPSYLDTTEEEIFAARNKHSACGPCMKAGLPYVGIAIEQSDDIRQIIKDHLAANGDDKYVYFPNRAITKWPILRGSIGRRIKNAVWRRLRSISARPA